MESIRSPLERLVASLQWFVVAKEIKLLQVLAEADLRVAVPEHVAAAEHHSLNRAPFVVLEASVEPDDAGWSTRVDELDLEMTEVRKALSAGGAPIELQESDRASEQKRKRKQGLRDFGVALGAALRSVPSPLEGLTVVLAPLAVDDPPRWAADVGALLKQRELSTARFIVVGDDSPTLGKLRESLGAGAELVDARVDPEASRRDMAELLSAMEAAPAGNTGPRAAGAAGPSVEPPPRRNAPPKSVEEQVSALAGVGLPASLADPQVGKELRLAVLGAAQAMGGNDPVEAVRLFRKAIDLCREAGLCREAVMFQVMLGGAVLQLGRPEAALPVLEEAERSAEAQDFHELHIQALISQGLTLFLCKRIDEAASAYERAGRFGAKHEQTALAIEAYRLCGQLLFSRKRIEPAIHAWKKALELAEAAPAEVASMSSAPLVARTLADACRTHGLKTQAESLETQAASLERAPATPTDAEEAVEALPPPAQQSVTQTMEMIIDELFPPDDPRYREFYGDEGDREPPRRPLSEDIVEYEATVVLKDLAVQRPVHHDRNPSMELDAMPLAAEHRSRHDRAPTIEFDVPGFMSFKLPFVKKILGFVPSFRTAGIPGIDESSELFAPVDMSQFRPEPGYARTQEMDSVDDGTQPSRSKQTPPAIAPERPVEPVVRPVHHTAAQSMELDALMLPDDFEPPPFEDDEDY